MRLNKKNYNNEKVFLCELNWAILKKVVHNSEHIYFGD